MAMTIAPTLKITSTSVSVKEAFSLNLANLLTVDTPLTNITKVATATTPGVILLGTEDVSTKVVPIYVYNADSTDTITICYDKATDPENVTILAPNEFSFWAIPTGITTVSAIASANTPLLEYGYWTKG
jgi:hypothetical protein